jgi:hypothetical protein
LQAVVGEERSEEEHPAVGERCDRGFRHVPEIRMFLEFMVSSVLISSRQQAHQHDAHYRAAEEDSKQQVLLLSISSILDNLIDINPEDQLDQTSKSKWYICGKFKIFF